MALFGVQGIRDAMTGSYQKHLQKLRGQVLPGGTSLHLAALYGALATRQMAGGKFTGEVGVWVELLPFMHLGEVEGIEALAEYVVFKEMPAAANTELLRAALKRGLSLLNSEEGEVLTLARAQVVPWTSLA